MKHGGALMPKAVGVAIILAASALTGDAQVRERAGPHVPVPANIDAPRGGVTVEMQEWGGRPVIEVAINGHGPYRFILDTGAAATVVSEELSRELALAPLAGVAVASANGGPAPAIAMIDDLRIGGATLRGVI